jgi:hemoglobin
MRTLPRILVAVLLSSGVALPSRALAQEPEPEKSEQEPRPRSLFERAGGTYVMAQMVDEFVDAMLADPVIRANAAVKQAVKAERRAGLKFQILSLLCQESGGPCKYEGRTMREAHHAMDLSEREWNAAVRTFKRALVRAAVPPAEREELMNILATTKGDIVSAAPRK